MSGLVGRIFDSVTNALDYNRATLSGAIDIVVVRQPDGSLMSTPFHVRFGKLRLLHSRDKIVQITVNGVSTNLRMKLGSHGDAFFVVENQEGTLEVTSPITSPRLSGKTSPKSSAESTSTPVSPPSLPLPLPTTQSPVKTADDIFLAPSNLSLTQTSSLVPLPQFSKNDSNTSVSSSSSVVRADSPPGIDTASIGAPSPARSDGQYEWEWGGTIRKSETPQPGSVKVLSQGPADTRSADTRSWVGSLFSVFRGGSSAGQPGGSDDMKQKNEKVSGYLSDGDDPSSLAETNATVTARSAPGSSSASPALSGFSSDLKYKLDQLSLDVPVDEKSKLMDRSAGADSVGGSDDDDDDDDRSNKDKQPPRCLMSLCGDLIASAEQEYRAWCSQHIDGDRSSACPSALPLTPDLADLFASKVISFDNFNSNPFTIMNNPLLRVLLLITETDDESESGKKRSWPCIFQWEAAAAIVFADAMFSTGLTLSPLRIHSKRSASILTDSSLQQQKQWWWRRLWGGNSSRPGSVAEPGGVLLEHGINGGKQASVSVTVVSDDESNEKSTAITTVSTGSSSLGHDRRVSSQSWGKSTKPTSDQLLSLNLKEGYNEIEFIVESNKSFVSAGMYLWQWNDRVVISDVDGTITTSDVLGQLLPAMGIDWYQSNVATLFKKIYENGFKMLYLTARAIGQANPTRAFIKSLQQPDDGGQAIFLPPGPVIMSPDGLLTSFTREVIRRKPEEFKVVCLLDIKSLFPADLNPQPLYSGFGNRSTDAISYLQAGVDKGRIFIINPKGHVTVPDSAYRTTYTKLSSMVDQVFPCITKPSPEPLVPSTFNDFQHWRIHSYPEEVHTDSDVEA